MVAVDIKRDKQTMRNLGYGFVQMSTHEEAEVAKEKMHEAEIQGRKIRVGWAQRNTALFIGTCSHICVDLCLVISLSHLYCYGHDSITHRRSR